MSERVPARIQFGGRLDVKFVPQLIQLLTQQCLHTAEGGNDPDAGNLHEAFSDDQVKYVDLTDLEDFALRHELAYEIWCDAGSEWMETTYKYTPDAARTGQLVGSRENGFYLAEDQLDGGAELLTWMKAPLPRLEIIAGDELPTFVAAEPLPSTHPTFRVRVTQVLRIQRSAIVTVGAEDEADLAAMIEEGSIDLPGDDVGGAWTIDHSSLENEVQEEV